MSVRLLGQISNSNDAIGRAQIKPRRVIFALLACTMFMKCLCEFDINSGRGSSRVVALVVEFKF